MSPLSNLIKQRLVNILRGLLACHTYKMRAGKTTSEIISYSLNLDSGFSDFNNFWQKYVNKFDTVG